MNNNISEVIVSTLGMIKDIKVKEAVWYYLGLPKNIRPIEDKGWINIPVKVRLEASRWIAEMPIL